MNMRLLVTEVTAGDVLLFFPDNESLAEDRKLGYFLSASLGRVYRVEMYCVHVEWMFGETYTGEFRQFILQDGRLYRSVIPECEIYTGDTTSSKPIKAEFDARNRLKSRTKNIIKSVIGENEFNKYS
jgi:hypothetical protein